MEEHERSKYYEGTDNKRDKISQNTNNRDFGKGDKLPVAKYLEKDNKTKNSLIGGKII